VPMGNKEIGAEDDRKRYTAQNQSDRKGEGMSVLYFEILKRKKDHEKYDAPAYRELISKINTLVEDPLQRLEDPVRKSEDPFETVSKA